MGNKKSTVTKQLRKLIDNLDSTKFLANYNNSFLQPLDNINIKNNLKGNKSIEKIEHYFITYNNEDLDYKKIYLQYKKFKRYIRGANFNPKKDYYPSKYYEKNEKNFQNGLDLIFEALTDNDEERIEENFYFKGEKGGGKTITQNIWLYENNDRLEKNKIFWVRCDAHKLYKIWANETNPNNYNYLISIDEYLSMQFIYILAKYSFFENREFFQEISKIINGTDETYEHVIAKKDKDTVFGKNTISVDTEVSKGFNNLINLIKQRENYNEDSKNYKKAESEPTYSVIVEEYMKKNQHQKEKGKAGLVNLSKKIQDILIEKGYKFLFIVDGADNIEQDSHNDSSLFYQKMIREVGTFINKPFNKYIIKLVVGRERTSNDLFGASGILLREGVPNLNPPLPLTFYPVSFVNILEKRFNFIKIENLFLEKTIFINVLQELLNENSSLNIPPYNNEQLYHNNIRAFLYNMLELAMLLSFRYYQRPKRLRHNFNIKKQIDIFLPRNRYLNGHVYLDYHNEYDNIEDKMGKFCFNIFSFDIGHKSNSWEGLCVTRILQILISHTNLEENKIIQILLTTFNYTANNIKNNINKLRSYGMIDTVTNNNNTNICYKISEKGKFTYKEIYEDINILYIFALSSPLPKKFFDLDLIKAHTNDIPTITTHYNSSCFSTVISFLIFLFCIEKKEIKNYKNDTYIYDDYFKLPIHNKSNKQKIYSELIKLYKFEPKEVEKVINLLVKII